MPHVVGIIPARLASTRLPRKVLLRETGKFLIQHVHEAARRAASLTRLVIATDSVEVMDACRGFGAECVLTRADHVNGTSRLAEAADLLDLPDDSIVVNIQGDEPEMDAAAIDAGISRLLDPGAASCPVATIAAPMLDEEFSNPSIVKVVCRLDGTALYFSRSPIPHRRDSGPASASGTLRHVGIYMYRRWFLSTYIALAPTPLEQSEVLEQLRILEHGHQIAVAVHACSGSGIDTHEQYQAFVARVRGKETFPPRLQ